MVQRKKSKPGILALLYKEIVLLLLVFILPIINCSKKVNDVNVILISIDTLRYDHLSCYGYKRNTSPFLAKIAKDGILFENVIPSSSWTAPSMVSMFTSLNSSEHGIIHGTFKNGNVYNQEALKESLITLPVILKKHGFFTMGFSTNPHLSKKLGFAKGFDVFVYAPFYDSQKLNKVILDFKTKYLKKDKKFFLWIHYMDPHWPYIARNPWMKEYANKDFNDINFQLLPWAFKDKYELDGNKDLLENLIARYDSEINFLDTKISSLYKSLPVDDNNLVIITADHGEEFLEHDGFTHGNNLYNQTTRVPLIIKLPSFMNKKGISIEDNVGIIDIVPTLLSLLNIPVEPKFQGKNLMPLIENGKTFKKRIIISELFKGIKNILSFTQDRWKYIYDFKTNKAELFDLKSDKDEKVNLIDKNLVIKSSMEKQLKAHLESLKGKKIQARLVRPDKKNVESLKSLGYIE